MGEHTYFSSEEQSLFAKFSGDYNPLHLDSLLTRRAIMGEPVVHGVHVCLRLLNYLLVQSDELVNIKSIRASFQKPVLLNEMLTIRTATEGDVYRLEAISGSVLKCFILLEFQNCVYSRSTEVIRRCPPIEACVKQEHEEIESSSGVLEIFCDASLCAQLFPNLHCKVSELQIGALLAMSRLVGMKSPGHNSILAELSVTFDSCLIGGELSYHVTQFDSRFSLASIEVRSSFLSGRIKAFYRPDPREQLDYLNIKSMVDENEFSGQTALVIGGSRGLGEATAKLLSAGGATVAFTYNQGEEKAQTIVSDVSRYGGQISCHYYNVLDACTFPTDLSSFVVSMSHMYYFATPSIFVGSANDLSPVLLDKFIRFYVHGFYKFVEVLRMKTSKFSIFYPSTVAIEENNVRMAEYIIAKMAGEQLGKLIEVRHSGIQVYSPRLQRLATDQTQGFVSGPSQDAASALLPLIREFSSKRGKGAWDAIK